MILSHILPSLVVHNMRHASVINSESIRQLLLFRTPISVQPTNPTNVVFREFGFVVLLPKRMSFLFNHVCRVVRARAKKKMIRIHTGGVVTGMTDEQPLGYRAGEKFIGNLMSFSMSFFKPKFSVAVSTLSGCPFPAFSKSRPTQNLFDVSKKLAVSRAKFFKAYTTRERFPTVGARDRTLRLRHKISSFSKHRQGPSITQGDNKSNTKIMRYRTWL